MTGICPECGDQWLYSLTFAHANDCDLRVQDDGRRAADHELLAGWPAPFTRPATATELTLAAALGWTAPADPTTGVTCWVIPVTATITTRRLQIGAGSVWDPDQETS